MEKLRSLFARNLDESQELNDNREDRAVSNDHRSAFPRHFVGNPAESLNCGIKPRLVYSHDRHRRVHPITAHTP
jgi:hypothetical protein